MTWIFRRCVCILHTKKNEVSIGQLAFKSWSLSRQTETQTHVTEYITTPHSPVLTVSKASLTKHRLKCGLVFELSSTGHVSASRSSSITGCHAVHCCYTVAAAVIVACTGDDHGVITNHHVWSTSTRRHVVGQPTFVMRSKIDVPSSAMISIITFSQNTCYKYFNNYITNL